MKLRHRGGGAPARILRQQRGEKRGRTALGGRLEQRAALAQQPQVEVGQVPVGLQQQARAVREADFLEIARRGGARWRATAGAAAACGFNETSVSRVGVR